jgi:hypothetical protein
VLLLATAAPARAVSTSEALEASARAAFDLAILRPLGLVQTLVGAAAFVPFYPISLLTGGSEHVMHVCIENPIERTFRRPLGEL